MNKNEFVLNLKKLNINITEEQLNTLEKYYLYLKEYNQHTNLTRIIEEKDVYLKHFYDSLTIVKVINLNEISNLLDIGAGAGFPGVVLKIMFPHLEITLLDSNNKKTKFLTSLLEKINLKINVINDRAENYAKNNLNKFDLVTARAVANLRVLSELCVPFVKKDGYFIAMKGSSDVELDEANETLNILSMELVKIEKFNLPIENSERSILMFKKNNEFKLKNLRLYEKIVKNPLKNLAK